MLKILLLGLFAFPAVISAQTGVKEPEPAGYFDFWVGEWKLEWEEGDGKKGSGTNKIEKILDGKVLLENFEALSGQMRGYKGKSFSVYNPRAKEWKQTWVDSNGGYLDFVGKIDGQKRIFERTATDREGNPIIQRMVFSDIKENSLTWDWEYSGDGGETWELRWRIEYTRIQ